jgi:hypothetical protein
VHSSSTAAHLTTRHTCVVSLEFKLKSSFVGFFFAQCTCWGVYVSTRLPMLNTSLALRVFLLRLSVRSVRCFHVSSYTGGDGTDRVCARPLSYMSLSPHVFLSYVLRSFPSRRLCAWPSERAGLRQPLTSCTGRWVIRFLGTVST